MQNLPVYVISLPEEKTRRERIVKIMDEAGLNFDFIDAVDGRDINVLEQPVYDGPARLRRFGTHLKGGEIGCLLSHKKTYQHMADHHINRALILEDDVVLMDSFMDVLENLLNSDIPYEMVRFVSSRKLEKLKLRNVVKINDTHCLVRHTGMPGGAYATLMTLAGAKKALAHLDKTPYPIDALLGRGWLTGINWYTVRPGLAKVDLSFDSAIGDERFDKTKNLSNYAKIFFPLTRGWFKFCETLGKKYWYYKQLPLDKKLSNKKLSGQKSKGKKHG